MNDHPYTPDRRPLASRDRAFSKYLASWLAQRGASPNGISLAGMAAGIAGGGAFALTPWLQWRPFAFLAAALFIQLRLLANMLDGMVAIESGKASPVGALYNEIPDRVSDAAICIGAGYAADSLPELGYVAACVAIFVAYVRVQGKVAGAQQEFCGPMAKPQRMFTLTAVAVYCGLTPLAWQPTVSEPVAVGPVGWALALIIVGGIWTAWRRLARIVRALMLHLPGDGKRRHIP